MIKQEELTIKQLAKIAGVSARTLHYYDEIGLLKPQRVKENNYRSYDHASLLKLQQILFFKELEFSLDQITRILTHPDFEMVSALHDHREALRKRTERLNELIETIDNTIENLKGKKDMTQQQYFKGFSGEQQAEYEKQAAEQWDPALVKQSSRMWKNLTKAEKDALLANGERITLAIRDSMPLGSGSPQIQTLVGEWHAYIGKFYTCSYKILSGLGKAYAKHPEFRAFYTKIHPDLPDFLNAAIQQYCAENGFHN